MPQPINPNDEVELGARRRLNVTLADAIAVIIAFFWETRNGGPASGANPFKFAGHSYDFVLRGYHDPIVAGVYASTGLNSELGSTEMLSILAANDAGLIPHLDDSVAFWDMDVNKIISDPNDNSPEGLLWSFYKAFMGEKVNGVKTGGIARVGPAGYSKTAAHAWPKQMPLVDSQVLKFWTGNAVWPEMYKALNDNRAWFDELERLVEVYRTQHQSSDGVQIWRLRCLDVLIWVAATGQWDATLKAGEELLADCPPLPIW